MGCAEPREPRPRFPAPGIALQVDAHQEVGCGIFAGPITPSGRGSKRPQGNPASVSRVIAALDVTVQLGAMEIDVAQGTAGIAFGLIVEVC